MKRFSQYIDEVSEPKEYRRLEADGGGGGGPSLKDLTGIPMPSDQAIAAGIASTAAGGMSASNLTGAKNIPYQVTVKRGAPEIGSRIGDPIPTKIPRSRFGDVNKAINRAQKNSNRNAAAEVIMMKAREMDKDE